MDEQFKHSLGVLREAILSQKGASEVESRWSRQDKVKALRSVTSTLVGIAAENVNKLSNPPGISQSVYQLLVAASGVGFSLSGTEPNDLPVTPEWVVGILHSVLRLLSDSDQSVRTAASECFAIGFRWVSKSVYVSLYRSFSIFFSSFVHFFFQIGLLFLFFFQF